MNQTEQDLHELFFQLLQVAVGNRRELTVCPSAQQWQELYALCQKQALLGIGFAALAQLPQSQWPSRLLKLQWMAQADKIAQCNQKVTQDSVTLARQLEADGFWACILKGQGNLEDYPQALRPYRRPGDIDVWMTPQEGTGHPHRRVLDYVEQKTPGQFVCYLHVDFPCLPQTEVEVHIRPSFLCTPWRNRRLQQWFRSQAGACSRRAEAGFLIPTPAFNAQYQLLHIFKHLFEEGIGLKQLLDYYMVLRSWKPQEAEQVQFREQLHQLGLQNFAAGVCFVLQRVFLAQAAELPLEPQANEGIFLLDEILRAGNLGRYDDRMAHGERNLMFAWKKLMHNFRLIHHYPSEVLWEPVFRWYHFFWRFCKVWKRE